MLNGKDINPSRAPYCSRCSPGRAWDRQSRPNSIKSCSRRASLWCPPETTFLFGHTDDDAVSQLREAKVAFVVIGLLVAAGVLQRGCIALTEFAPRVSLLSHASGSLLPPCARSSCT